MQKNLQQAKNSQQKILIRRRHRTASILATSSTVRLVSSKVHTLAVMRSATCCDSKESVKSLLRNLGLQVDSHETDASRSAQRHLALLGPSSARYSQL
jgi:hypothetical protein